MKTENTPVYATVLVLHPARRTQYIWKNWKKEWQRPSINSIKKLWESSYLNTPVNYLISLSQEENNQAQPVNKLGQLLQSLEVILKQSREDKYT